MTDDNVITLPGRSAEDDDWSAPPHLTSWILALGAQRGYGPDFVAAQHNRLIDIRRTLYGYRDDSKPVRVKINGLDDLSAEMRDALLHDVQACLGEQRALFNDIVDRAWCEMVEAAFPEASGSDDDEAAS